MWSKCLVAVLIACSLAACDESPTSPDALEPVTAVATADGIRLTNTGELPLGVATIDRRSLALLSPCIDPSPACVRLHANGSLFVPYTEVLFFGADTTEVLIHCWRVVPRPSGGYQASGLQEIVVNVRR